MFCSHFISFHFISPIPYSLTSHSSSRFCAYQNLGITHTHLLTTAKVTFNRVSYIHTISQPVYHHTKSHQIDIPKVKFAYMQQAAYDMYLPTSSHARLWSANAMRCRNEGSQYVCVYACMQSLRQLLIQARPKQSRAKHPYSHPLVPHVP